MTDQAGHDENRTRPPGSSLAEMVTESSAPDFRQSFPRRTILKVAVLAVLFAWLNFWQFEYLLGRWIDDTNWSHGFLIPLFSLYFLYSRREELFSARRRVCLWGLPVMILGIAQMVGGLYPLQVRWISLLGMIVVLFGLTLYLAGPGIIRVTWLPIVFLAFAMPIPDRLYVLFSEPLQGLAASASAMVLRLFGVVISVQASHLQLKSVSGQSYPLTVAEACSGIRLLMAFLALGVAMAYLDAKPLWQRVVLVVMGVPIAIACNVLRVIITATMHVWDQPDLGKDFMHEFTGMLMLVPALLMLWGLSWLLGNLFVEEDGGDHAPADRAGQAAGRAKA